MTDLHLFMLICIHNDLDALKWIVGMVCVAYCLDGLTRKAAR